MTAVLNKVVYLRKILSLLPYETLYSVLKPYGMLAAIDPRSGKTLKVFQDPSGTSGYLAGAHFHQKYVYLTSWKNRFLGRIAKSKLELS